MHNIRRTLSTQLNLPRRTASSPSLSETSPLIRRETLASLPNDAFEESPSDAHSPKALLESYYRFRKLVSDLQHELHLFSSECRQLGRSYALILATRELHEGLKNLSSKFHDNVTHLSPGIMDSGRPMKPNRPNKLSHPTKNESMSGAEYFPVWFEGVAEACDSFRERLDEFREYTDESAEIKSYMAFFANDLRYRADCLREYKGRLENKDMRHYIHDLADEMGNDLTNMIEAFRVFNEYGMSAMQYEQRRDTDTLHNMSTVATFFSAVTATTLQISLNFDEEAYPLVPVVNTFWFCSLVLSIGAALNSLLAVTWKRTPHGSRGRRLPISVTIWVHFSAPFFLTISIASFSAGLVFFTYAINQSDHTKIITLVATAVTSSGLLVMSSWFGYELWIAPLMIQNGRHRQFSGRKRQRKELSSNGLVRSSTTEHPPSRSGSLSSRSDHSTRSEISSSNNISHALFSRLPGPDLLSKVAALIRQETSSSSTRSHDLESQTVPSINVRGSASVLQPSVRRGQSVKLVTTFKSIANRLIYGAESTPTSPVAVGMSHTLTSDSLRDPESSIPQLSFPEKPRSTIPLPAGELQDLEYSPDGEFLATTSYDKETSSSLTTVYTVNLNYQLTGQYIHPRAVSKKVSWSSDCTRILIQLDRSISFVDKGGYQVSLVRRPQRIESASWLLPENVRNTIVLDFLTAERSTVFRINLDGQVQAKYRFDNLLLRDVAVTPHPGLLLVTGRVSFSRQEVLPHNSRGEKQIILYNTIGERCISRDPILDDVRHIRLAKIPSFTRRGFDILLSHNNKNKNQPQLWTLPLDISGPELLRPAKFSLQPSSELTGHGHFIGEQDQMMACVGLDGDIHIWDRESGKHMHRLKAQTINRGLRCFAWRPQSTDSTTFVSVAAKELQIWSNDEQAAGSDSLPSQTQIPVQISPTDSC